MYPLTFFSPAHGYTEPPLHNGDSRLMGFKKQSEKINIQGLSTAIQFCYQNQIIFRSFFNSVGPSLLFPSMTVNN